MYGFGYGYGYMAGMHTQLDIMLDNVAEMKILEQKWNIVYTLVTIKSQKKKLISITLFQAQFCFI